MKHSLTLATVLTVVVLCGACTTTSGGSKPSPELAAKYNAKIAANYIQSGRMELARRKLAEARKQAPHSVIVHNTLALYYIKLGLYDKAEKQYELSLQYDPGDPETMNNYGVFLCSHGRPRESLQYFLRAAEDLSYATPDAALANAGLCALKIPNEEKASQYFQRALAVNPDQRQALWQLSLLAFEDGRYSASYHYVSRLLAHDSRPSARVLWVAVEAAWIIGRRDDAQAFGRKLLKLYPDSKEASHFIKLIGHAQ